MDLDQILEQTEFTQSDALAFTEQFPEVGLSESVINQETKVALALESLRQTILQNNKAPLRDCGANILRTTLKSFKMESIVPEQFGSYDARLANTQLVLEGLGENIRKIGAKILAWIKRIAEMVFGFIEGFFNEADTLAGNAQALQDRALKVRADTKTDKSVERQINGKAVISLFSDAHGHDYTAKEIVQKYLGFTKDMNEALAEKTVTRACQYLADFLKGTYEKKLTGAFTEDVAKDLSHEVITHMLDQNFPQFVVVEGGNRQYVSPFGGFEMTVTVTDHDGKHTSIGLSKKLGGSSGKQTITALTPDEVIELAKTVESSMQRGIYHNYKAIRGKLWELRTAVSDTCDKIVRAQGDTTTGSIPSLHFLRSATGVIYELVTIAYKHNGMVAKGILHYCDISLKAYSKG